MLPSTSSTDMSSFTCSPVRRRFEGGRYVTAGLWVSDTAPRYNAAARAQ
jgi:hypothetical protein